MTIETFQHCMARLAAMFTRGTQGTDAEYRVTVYWEALEHAMTDAEMRHATAWALKRSTFFPAAAELLDHARPAMGERYVPNAEETQLLLAADLEPPRALLPARYAEAADRTVAIRIRLGQFARDMSRYRRAYVIDGQQNCIGAAGWTAHAITVLRRELGLSYSKPGAEAADQAGITVEIAMGGDIQPVRRIA